MSDKLPLLLLPYFISMEDLKVALVTRLKDYLYPGIKRIETRIQSLGRLKTDIKRTYKVT